MLDKTTTVAEDTGGVTMDTTPIASCPNEWHLAPLEYMIAVVEPHFYIHYENCVINSTVCKTVWHHYTTSMKQLLSTVICCFFVIFRRYILFVTIYSCAFNFIQEGIPAGKVWAS